MSDQPVPTSDATSVAVGDQLMQSSAQPSSVTARLSDASRQLLTQTPAQASAPDPSLADNSPEVSQNAENLALFDAILTEAEQQQPALAEPTPFQPNPTQPDPTQPQPTGVRKEQLEGGVATGAPAELPGGMQYVEIEPNPEIPPEVESYLSNVDSNPDRQPQEIVIAAPAKQTYAPPAPKRTVRVLPITKEEAEAAKRQGVQHSIRWLYEFSEKLTKLFFNAVIYRQEMPNEKQ